MNTVLLRCLTRWNTLKYWADAKNLRQHEDKVLLMLTLLIGATVGLVIVAFIVLTENLDVRHCFQQFGIGGKEMPEAMPGGALSFRSWVH